MSYPYKTIITKAKNVKQNVKKEYELGASSKWSYYFAKAILNPKKDISGLSFDTAPNPQTTHISNQIKKNDYIQICKDLVKFVENPKNKRLPNYVQYGNYKLAPKLLTEIFSRILVFYDENNRLPSKADANSKCFTKSVETGNVVYDYFTQKTGKRFTTIDDLLNFVKLYFKYLKYFDDHKSNKEVIDSKSGNCTDLLQFLINMAKAMGYDCKCIHVKCRKSGTGHVFGKFKHAKHTGGNWIIRDIAAVADGGSITSVWCSDGIVQATDPSWFMANLNR